MLLFLFGLFVCFVFTGKMLYPDVQVVMLLHGMLLWVVKLTVEVPFHCENPPDTLIPSVCLCWLFSPLWLHLARPDSWFYLVLSLADLTFWSHGPQSSKGAWAEWLWAVKTVHPSWGWSWGHAEKTRCFIFRTGERAATESGGSSSAPRDSFINSRLSNLLWGMTPQGRDWICLSG